MKNIIIVCISLLSALFSKKAVAQEGSATLNINLYAVQTIEVNDSDHTVNLDYQTKEDYMQGVSLSKENHLKIYSTGGFVIRVRTSDLQLSSSTNSESIDASDITVTAAKGTANGLDSFTSAAVQLSGTDREFISSTTGADRKTFDITYSAKGDNKYLNLFTKNQNPTVYTTQVVYSILPI
jgi:hypothetical protein